MDPLTIALAIYGGYQGYKSAKKSGAGTAGRILGAALGAYGGYNLGSGITGSALGQQYLPSFLTQPVTPGVSELVSSGIGSLSSIVPSFGTDVATTAVTDGLTTAALDGGMQAGLGAYNPELASFGADAVAGKFQPLQTLSTAAPTNYFSPMESQYAGPGQFSAPATPGRIPPSAPFKMDYTGIDDLSQVGQYTEKKPTSFLDQAKQTGKDAYSYLFEKQVKGGKPGEKELDITKAALFGVPALAYASGAFEREPYERSMFTYNVNYPDLYRGRKFYTQDPKTGEVKELPQQGYIPEERADVQEGSKFGPYRRETITLQQGGLATLNHFKDGGVNYLPSKTIHDEDDEDNYIRTNGYVEDGAGNGDKEEDTMLAQLADGEFVTRTDGVLGAGILAGANPKNAKEMRKLGAEFFYEQQKRFKRIYDLLDASRKATAH
jgi:hypothetical protein